jgi:cell division septal protein FtsQ
MINEKKKTRSPKKKAPPRQHPEVTYTPPVPINRKKLLIRLLTVMAAALALFLGCTVFFRVKDVTVTGTERYTAWSIREASGIEEGSSLLAFGKTRAAGKIMESLRYVKSVRIGITLPDTVNIHIEELEVVYGAQDAADSWWLMSCDGRVVEQTTEAKARETTLLKGFRLKSPVAGENAVAQEFEQPEDAETPILIRDQERLEAALSVITQLERNEILGDAASVDVTDPANIQLWYKDDYQVLLGDPDRMDEKIMMMNRVIRQHDQEGGYQSGVLDISLTTTPDGVGYTPFG